jgi:hypothetical protein
MFSMRLIALFALVVITPAGWSKEARQQEATEPRDSVRVLTIGNSFTANATEFLPGFATSAGKELMLFRADIGGASFERHWNGVLAFEADSESDKGRPYKKLRHPISGEERDFSLREALEATDWDFVTVQQVSSQSFRPETFGLGRRLIEYIRQHAPAAEILVHQTWAYHDDFAGFAAADFDADVMHLRLRAAYDGLAEEYGLRQIPSGDAFHLARRTSRWSFQRDPDFAYDNPPPGTLPDQSSSLHVGYMWRSVGGDGVFHLDYRHANAAGKYLGACVWYEMLFGEPVPAAGPLPTTLTPEAAAELRKMAQQAIRSRLRE